MRSTGRWPAICSGGEESSWRRKYKERSARMRSNGQNNHERAPVIEYFEVHHVAITEKVINIYH